MLYKQTIKSKCDYANNNPGIAYSVQVETISAMKRSKIKITCIKVHVEILDVPGSRHFSKAVS
jgi:hypothetical protein